MSSVTTVVAVFRSKNIECIGELFSKQLIHLEFSLLSNQAISLTKHLVSIFCDLIAWKNEFTPLEKILIRCEHKLF